MPKQIEVPGAGVIDFPDSMSDDDIVAAIKTQIIPQYVDKKPKPKPLPEKITDFTLSDWGNLLKQSYQGAVEAIDKSGGRKPIVVPALVSGAGELIKSAGAVGELFTERAKPVTEFGKGITEAGKEISPAGGTVGQMGSYLVPFTGALKATQAVANAPRVIQAARTGQALTGPIAPAAATTLGRTAQAATAGGITGALTTPGTAEERAQEAALQAAMAGGAELVLPYAAGVVKGAYNKFRGQEAPRMYNVGSGLPESALPFGQTTARAMTPEVAAAYPKTASVPMPGTAGEQTGARLYDYATSLRPYLDVAGYGTVGSVGGLAGEILGKQGLGRAIGLPFRDMPGFRSESLPEIGINAVKEAFQSNKLQGMMPRQNAGFFAGMMPREPQAAGPVAPTQPATAPRPTPAPPPQTTAGPVQPQSPAQQAAQAQGITPPSNAIESGFAQTMDVADLAQRRARLDKINAYNQANGLPPVPIPAELQNIPQAAAPVKIDPYVALEQQLAERGYTADILKNTAISTRAKQIIDEAKANKIVISKKDATTQAQREYDARQSAKAAEERTKRQEAERLAAEKRQADEAAAKAAYEASPEGQAARQAAEAEAAKAAEVQRRAEEIKNKIRSRVAQSEQPTGMAALEQPVSAPVSAPAPVTAPVSGPVKPAVSTELAPELSIPTVAKPSKLAELREKAAQDISEPSAEALKVNQTWENRSAAQRDRHEVTREAREWIVTSKSGGVRTVSKSAMDEWAQTKGIILDWSTAPDISKLTPNEAKRKLSQWAQQQYKNFDPANPPKKVLSPTEQLFGEKPTVGGPVKPTEPVKHITDLTPEQREANRQKLLQDILARDQKKNNPPPGTMSMVTQPETQVVSQAPKVKTDPTQPLGSLRNPLPDQQAAVDFNKSKMFDMLQGKPVDYAYQDADGVTQVLKNIDIPDVGKLDLTTKYSKLPGQTRGVKLDITGNTPQGRFAQTLEIMDPRVMDMADMVKSNPESYAMITQFTGAIPNKTGSKELVDFRRFLEKDMGTETRIQAEQKLGNKTVLIEQIIPDTGNATLRITAGKKSEFWDASKPSQTPYPVNKDPAQRLTQQDLARILDRELGVNSPKNTGGPVIPKQNDLTDYPIHKNSLLESNIPFKEEPGKLTVSAKQPEIYWDFGDGFPGIELTSDMKKILTNHKKDWDAFKSSTANYGKDGNMTSQEWIVAATKKNPTEYKIVKDFTHPDLEISLYQQSPTGTWKKLASDLDD